MLIKLDHVNDYTAYSGEDIDSKDYVFTFNRKPDGCKKIIITTDGNDLVKSVWMHKITLDEDQNETSNTVTAWGYAVPEYRFSISRVLTFSYLDTDDLIACCNEYLRDMTDK